MVKTMTSEIATPPRMYSVAELSRAAGVSERTIRDAIRGGRLAATRVGPVNIRVTHAAWVEFVERERYVGPAECRDPRRHGRAKVR